jgi:hypothetical protein
MQDQAAERLHASPCRLIRIVGQAGRDHDDRSASRILARLGAPCWPVTPHRANRRVEDRLQIELGAVGFEIIDNVSARRVAAVRTRDRQAGQAGAGSIGVQMEAVVMPPPDRPDCVGFSRIEALRPRARRAAAVARPAGPAPMMMASHELVIVRLFSNATTFSP